MDIPGSALLLFALFGAGALLQLAEVWMRRRSRHRALGADDTNEWYGFRFQNNAIPAGSRVTEARLDIAYSEPPDILDVMAELTDREGWASGEIIRHP